MAPDANNRIKNNTGDFVRLADEEIQMWARTNKYLFTVPFLASGSGPCCNLKAKLMGREISKCYFEWQTVMNLTGSKETKADIKYNIGYYQPAKDAQNSAKEVEYFEKYGPKLNLTIDNLAQLVMGPRGQPILSRITIDFNKMKMFGYQIDSLQLDLLDVEQPAARIDFGQDNLAPELNVPYEYRQLVYVCFEAEIKTGAVAVFMDYLSKDARDVGQNIENLKKTLQFMREREKKNKYPFEEDYNNCPK